MKNALATAVSQIAPTLMAVAVLFVVAALVAHLVARGRSRQQRQGIFLGVGAVAVLAAMLIAWLRLMAR